eukprot:gene1109-1444_t
MPPSSNGMASYSIEYKAPCLVQYNFPGQVTMLLYGLPTAKGWSRVIMGFASPAPGGRNPIMDGDSYFMHVG